MSMNAQGSAIFFINPSDDTIKQLSCPTGWTFSGETRDEIDTTCLGDSDSTFKMGIKDNGTLSSTVNYDVSQESHQLIATYLAGNTEDIRFCLAYSDGTDVPTVTGGEFDFPSTRSFKSFRGLVASFTETGQVNSVVSADISIRISGPITRSYKS